MKRSPVVHFEMPAKDNARASKFYTDAFGWEMQQTGEEMGNYLIAHTAETDENQMVKTPGTINGGFFKYEDKQGYNMPHLVINVDNLEESIEAVKKSGGKVDGEPMDIPGIGTYIGFTDSEDNYVGMLQPSR